MAGFSNSQTREIGIVFTGNACDPPLRDLTAFVGWVIEGSRGGAPGAPNAYLRPAPVNQQRDARKRRLSGFQAVPRIASSSA
jgi:hypothetical protein